MRESLPQTAGSGGGPLGATLGASLTLRALRTFGRAERPISVRRAVRLLRTPIGVATLLLCALAATSLADLVREGPINPHQFDRTVVLGALAIADIGAVLAFACRAYASLAARLVTRFPHAPLRAHPALVTVAAWHQVIAGALGAWAVALVLLLYVLHWHLFAKVLAGPLAWGYHTAALLSVMMIVGAAVVVFFRRSVLLAPDVPRRAQLATQAGLAGFLICLYGAYGAESYLASRAPDVLAAIGAGTSARILLLPPPLWVAVPESVAAAIVAGLACVGLTVAIWRALARGAHVLSRELPVDFASVDTSRTDRLSRLVVGRGRFRLAMAFLAKDLLLPVARMPGPYFVRQWLGLSLTLTVVLAAGHAFPDLRRSAAPAIAPFLAAWFAALQAPWAALNAFGNEGRRLGWLRFRLGARTLYLLKLGPAMLVVVAHTLVATAVALMAMHFGGFTNGPLFPTIPLSVAAAAVLTVYATAVAGLLTSYGESSIAPPIAGLGARLTYGFGACVYLGVHGALMLLMHLRALPPSIALVSSLTVLTLILIVSSAMSAFAVRRLSTVEFT